jgi:hypothetical protein
MLILLKMVVRPKHVADNFNKIVKTIEIELRLKETPQKSRRTHNITYKIHRRIIIG